VSGWDSWALTLAVFLPAAGAVVIAVVPSKDDRAPRALALAAQGGATIHLPDHRNLELQYQYQDRIDYYATHVLSASYTMSF
jgi:hypothetical protein